MVMRRRDFLSRTALAGLAAGARLAPLDAKGWVTPAPGTFAPAPGDSDEKIFAEARKQLMFPPSVTYCNTGTLGASPRPVVEALQSVAQLEHDLPDYPYCEAVHEPLSGYEDPKDIRTQLAGFFGATVDEVAITQNATMSMNFLANGLDLSPGDEIISTDQEHSGCIAPWQLKAKRYGIVVKELRLDDGTKGGVEGVMKLFTDAMTPRTKAVMFSHVVSGLGTRMPARDLCTMIRERGALALVDGAQAVGQMQVDVKELGCDAYVASPHKWMMAPKGTGFLYIRRDVQDRFWTTLASSHWADHENGAFRFMQYGTGAVPVHEGLMAALAFIDKIGMARIERWDTMLTKRLRDGLARIPAARISSPDDPRLASAITTFRIEGVKAKALQEALWARHVRVRPQSDARGVRLSAHWYANPADIDRVLEVTASLKR